MQELHLTQVWFSILTRITRKCLCIVLYGRSIFFFFTHKLLCWLHFRSDWYVHRSVARKLIARPSFCRKAVLQFPRFRFCKVCGLGVLQGPGMPQEPCRGWQSVPAGHRLWRKWRLWPGLGEPPGDTAWIRLLPAQAEQDQVTHTYLQHLNLTSEMPSLSWASFEMLEVKRIAFTAVPHRAGVTWATSRPFGNSATWVCCEAWWRLIYYCCCSAVVGCLKVFCRW